ncbi:MAG: hypothetical protein LBG87_08520 [Spirochaetaceae bacterium]|jgi:DNA-binding transcriptional regulator LsrR (DeoR family)|nr:hypothetical protein [Spirochaetaceae bacterium]
MVQRELRKLSLMAEIAVDYYEHGLNQDKIAEKLCLSRTRISKLLKEAFERGIIQVTVNFTYDRLYALEERVQSRFSLKRVLVLNNRKYDPFTIQRNVGNLAASYIMERLKADMIIGTAWGTTLRDTIKCLRPSAIPVYIFQLVGAVPQKTSNCIPQEIAASLAIILGGEAEYLNIPLIGAKQDNHQINLLKKAAFADMALTSIGDIAHIKDKKFWTEYMNTAMYEELCGKGAVGAMFARFFDDQGREIDCTWNKRCVSITMKDLQNIPDVVVIAASISKARAIFSAMKGNLIDTLIIDSETAEEILRINAVS